MHKEGWGKKILSLSTNVDDCCLGTLRYVQMTQKSFTNLSRLTFTEQIFRIKAEKIIAATKYTAFLFLLYIRTEVSVVGS